ncbi:HEPN domain-containing protein [Acidovorax sp. IB03]|jgi:HEPN domain-containing protein|uniref:HEPN domain-containing protein n=1 Tax=Acidovorax sp. IB03 TaxID=2779366 RepID=UPI0018E86E1F|nr:HEPN domain-containing protein [Acidovorax sp. IB03]MBJ2166163.1 HEPN domain-containing protein [Acidovorax sp. IB03]
MYNTDILLNDFAIRSFRDVADCDYIAARLSFRAQLVPQFLWQSLQAIEKYLKCILVLNRIKAPRSHDLSKLLDAFEQSKKFEVRLSPDTHKFLQYLDTYGRFRYYETPYYSMGDELFRLDTAVWELRRYARVLDYNVKPPGGTEVNLLALELKRNERAETKAPQEFSIMGGHLEKVLAKSDHPSRAGLVWHNLKFGKRRRTSVSYTRTSMSGNSPLSLHPEILDEVLKYVFLPKDVVEAYRNAV